MPLSKLLSVDDYEPFRRLTSSLLEKQPEFQIIGQASDGLEAIQKAEELQPDLVLLDIGLPKLNGMEAAKRIRIVAPHAKILIVSQISDSDVVAEALQLGAMGYVLKSNAGSELLPAIEAVLGGKQFVSKAGRDPLRPMSHYSFDFDPTNRILRFRLNGRITDELMRDFYYGMKEPARRIQPIGGLLDTSTVTSFEVSSQEIRQLAAAPPIMPDLDFPRVVIAPSSEVYGMMRMFAVQAELTRRNLHIVHTEREAWAILGVQNPRFEPLDTE
jgi:DNA-binding response OmpR family regulator